jgi:hypothetical protein
MWRKRKTGLSFGEIKSRENSLDNKGRLSLLLARILSVGFVMSAWWESLLSVFPMQISRTFLYLFLFAFSAAVLWILFMQGIKRILLVIVTGSILFVAGGMNKDFIKGVVNTLANGYFAIHYLEENLQYGYEIPPVSPAWIAFGIALASIPILAVFCFGQGRKMVRVPVVMLLFVPIILSAVEGYFPSPKSCALMVISAGIYFAVSKINTGKTVWREAVMAGVCLLILSVGAWGVSGFIEEIKKDNDYRYYELRSFISAQFIQPLEKKLMKEDKEESVERKNTQSIDAKLNEEKKTDIVNDDAVDFSLGNKKTGEEQNLQSISYFKPEETSDMMVVTDTRPVSTYYLPIQYGKRYEDSSWKSFAEDDKVYAEYSEYPETLSQLIKKCKSQTSFLTEDVSEFIQKEFEENTVYDFHPGVTPQNWDFAEYFLFKNQKGFCVHFATTAVLMYRISGIQARYAEGYAIPVSAFEATKEGTYTANVTGDMGHAWCETYNDGWVIQEHTLPYTGNVSSESGPAASAPTTENQQEKRSFNSIILCVFLFIVSFLIFWLQAVFRRKINSGNIRKYAKGRGILLLYLMLLDWAEVLGAPRGDNIEGVDVKALGNILPEVSAEQWIWIKHIVLQTRFGMDPPDKEDYKRFYVLVLKVVSNIWGRMTLWEKIKCKYIKCLP